MLLYLINVIDNTWLLALGGPLALLAARPGEDRRILRRCLFGAFLAGLLASLIYAFLRRNTGWVIREFYDLGVLVPAVLSAASLTALLALPRSPRAMPIARAVSAAALAILIMACAWYFREARPAAASAAILAAGLLLALSLGPLRIRGSALPVNCASCLLLAALAARCLPSLILYPLDFGVGIDSVFSAEYLSKVAGYCLGLAMMAALWLSVGFLARQAPPAAAKWFVAAALALIAGQLLLEAGQILAARRLIPRFWFRVVLWLLERENIFFWLQAALWGALAAALMVRSRLAIPVGANPALRRKARARLRSDFRSGVAVALAMAMVLFTATALRAVSRRGPVIAEPTKIAPRGDRLVMDLEGLSDGNLHRLAYDSPSGTPVRFIVVKKSQSAFGVGLDACDICGQSGYYQRGDQVVCKLCDVVMNKSTIGFPGGCNPVPLAFELSGGSMIIKTEDLEAEAYRFK